MSQTLKYALTDKATAVKSVLDIPTSLLSVDKLVLIYLIELSTGDVTEISTNTFLIKTGLKVAILEKKMPVLKELGFVRRFEIEGEKKKYKVRGQRALPPVKKVKKEKPDKIEENLFFIIWNELAVKYQLPKS